MKNLVKEYKDKIAHQEKLLSNITEAKRIERKNFHAGKYTQADYDDLMDEFFNDQQRQELKRQLYIQFLVDLEIAFDSINPFNN